MYALYGINVWAAYDTRLVTALVCRLPFEPRSLMRAQTVYGDLSWAGWDLMHSQLATVQDQLTLLGKATAQQKARLKPDERSPRPDVSGSRSVIKSNDSAGMMALFESING